MLGVPIVLFSRNKTVILYYCLCYFSTDNKEPIRHVRIYPSVRNYKGSTLIEISITLSTRVLPGSIQCKPKFMAVGDNK